MNILKVKNVFDRSLDQIQNRFFCWSFHIMDRQLRHMYGIFLQNASKTEYSLDDLIKRFVPFKRIIAMAIAFFLFGLVIPLPSHRDGSPNLDTTIWVGVLSLEGTFAIGFIAAAQWLVRIMSKMIPIMFTGAVDAGILKPAEGVEAEHMRAALESAVTKERGTFDVLGARLTVDGGSLLLIVILTMPLAIWVPPHWQIGILAATLIWVLSLVKSLMVPILLVYNDSMWMFFKALRHMHDKNISFCNVCTKAMLHGN